jgi:hypothetical protein
MRGSVTKFDKRRLCGRILGQDGSEVRFDKASLDGLNTRLLSVGDWVEFQENIRAEVFVPGNSGSPSVLLGRSRIVPGYHKLGRNESPPSPNQGTDMRSSITQINRTFYEGNVLHTTTLEK